MIELNEYYGPMSYDLVEYYGPMSYDLVEHYGPMSYDRVTKFVKKLKLSPEWERRILSRYKTLYEEGITVWNVDDAQNLGGKLAENRLLCPTRQNCRLTTH